jgi:TetR/AcrR family transcriptional regulator
LEGALGIAERREREKVKRKKDIVDAAERIFFSKGMDNATMDDVAEEAELSKGTLYLYFKNKEDLYLSIHLRGNHLLKSFFQKAVARAGTGIEKTKAIGEAYIMFYDKYPDYFNAMIYYESHEINFEDPESIAGQCLMEGKATLELLVDAIQLGISDGSIRPDIDPIKTAINLWGQTTGIIQIAALKEKIVLLRQYSLTAKEVIDYSFDLIYHAIKA